MSSWTPQPPQHQQLADRPSASSSRSSERCQTLLGSCQDPWWSLTELDHHLDSGHHHIPAATSTSCTYDNDINSLTDSPSWPLPLEDFLVLDHIHTQFPAAPPTSTTSASPEELALGVSPLLLQQDQQDQLYHELLQQHCQELLTSSSSSVTPALSSLEDPDMTYLSLFGDIGTEHGLGQNDGPNHHHHSRNPNHDIFAQENNNILSAGLHILPHPLQNSLSLQDPSTSAIPHDKTTTTNSVHHTFVNTSSAPSASSRTTPASSGLHIPTRPPRHSSPASSGSGSGSSKRKYSASPPADLDPDSEEAQVVIKRQRNTMAARKYRQKRLDRIADLESALGEVSNERDELKLQLARREAEVEALREMLSRK